MPRTTSRKSGITVFDTFTGENVVVSRKEVRLFVCGPTVYDSLHIGNARTYLVFDAFVTFLRAQKVKVIYLQNITDIDDKIIARAEEENVTPKTIAERYKKIYFANMKALGITSVDAYAPATKFIPQIAHQVERLIEKGNVYKIEGDGYYFNITTFPNYGNLSRRTVAQAEDGVSRIDESLKKRNRGDFCVWKLSSPVELKVKNYPTWNSPLGPGRPGWHIEDTAVTEHYFGPQYDIHGGGVDLKFPHHEAEIAQEESISGRHPLARIWMHVGSLTTDGKKMSKSLGNFVSIDQFLKDHDPNVLRLMSLSTHYRSPLDYGKASAKAHQESWGSILRFLGKLKRGPRTGRNVGMPRASRFRDMFIRHLSDDFGTPGALAALFSYISDLQPKLWTLSKEEAYEAGEFITTSLSMLGFSIALPNIPRDITRFASARENARISKQFIQADALRKKINDLGYFLEDTPLGPFLWPV